MNKTNKTTPDLTREVELITKAVTKKIIKVKKNLRNWTRNYKSKVYQDYIRDGKRILCAETNVEQMNAVLRKC